MKKICFLLMLLPLISTAQQNMPIGFSKSTTAPAKKPGTNNIILVDATRLPVPEKMTAKDALNHLADSIASKLNQAQEKEKSVKHFTFYGIGNLSDETFKNLNAGGKFAVRFCPNPTDKKKRTSYFASFNKNATNSDTLISTTLVFPEVGNHSFLFTVSPWTLYKPRGEDLIRHRGLFAEFAMKKINKQKDTGDVKSEEIVFQTLHYTLGYRYGFTKEKVIEGKTYNTSFNASLFASYVNIPDEDHTSFEKLTNRTASTNEFFSAGAKLTFEINGFQIFTDLRHVFGKEEKLPLKELKGFHSNIGVVFNAEIFNL